MYVFSNFRLHCLCGCYVYLLCSWSIYMTICTLQTPMTNEWSHDLWEISTLAELYKSCRQCLYSPYVAFQYPLKGASSLREIFIKWSSYNCQMISTLALWIGIFLSYQQHTSAGTVLPIAFHFTMSLRSTQVHLKVFLIFQFGQFIPSGYLATVSHIKRYVNNNTSSNDRHPTSKRVHRSL